MNLNRPFKEFRPGPLTLDAAEELNRAFELIQRLQEVNVQHPLEREWTPNSLELSVDVVHIFPALITAEATPNNYTFTEQLAMSSRGWDDKPNGVNGNTTIHPAHELNGLTGIAAGTYVWMMKGFLHNGSMDQDYRFLYPGVSNVTYPATFNNNVTFNNLANFTNNVTFHNQVNYHTLQHVTYYQNSSQIRFPCNQVVTSYMQLPVKTGDGASPSPGDYQYTKVPDEPASPGTMLYSPGVGNQADQGVWFQNTGTCCTGTGTSWQKVMTHRDLDNVTRTTQFANTVTFANQTTLTTLNHTTNYQNNSTVNVLHNSVINYWNNAAQTFNNNATSSFFTNAAQVFWNNTTLSHQNNSTTNYFTNSAVNFHNDTTLNFFDNATTNFNDNSVINFNNNSVVNFANNVTVTYGPNTNVAFQGTVSGAGGAVRTDLNQTTTDANQAWANMTNNNGVWYAIFFKNTGASNGTTLHWSQLQVDGVTWSNSSLFLSPGSETYFVKPVASDNKLFIQAHYWAFSTSAGSPTSLVMNLSRMA